MRTILASLRIIFMLTLWVAVPYGHGGTLVGGIVNGVWRTGGSPFYVTNNITVSSLAIEPGVHIVFLGPFTFSVPGIIKAIGTESDPIVFTRTNSIAKWGGIVFQNSGPGSELEHCRIEGSGNSGVRINDSQPSFRWCVIANNSSTAGGGGFSINMGSANLEIIGCTITNNVASRADGGGIRAIMGTGTLILSDCFVGGNSASITDGAIAGGGMNVQGNADLVRCVIRGNRADAHEAIPGGASAARGAGMFAAKGTTRLLNSTLLNNVAYSTAAGGMSGNRGFAYGGGFYQSGGNATLANTIVCANTASSTHGSEGGGVYADGAAVTVLNSTVMDNTLLGVACVNAATCSIQNSILYFNNGSRQQVSANCIVSFSDVQGSAPGQGNIDLNPIVNDQYEIVLGSPAVDAGNPDPRHNDICFPPSMGTARNDMGAHGGPGGCSWSGECTDLSIGREPQSVVTCSGQTIALGVVAVGSSPLRYQWYHNTNSPISGATNSTLAISNAQPADAGVYHVVVASPCDSIKSSFASVQVSPVCTSIALYAGLSFSMLTPGRFYSVEYSTNLLDATGWISLDNFTPTGATHFYLDPQPVSKPRRFYRVLECMP
ncbi:MAG: right-handed parallel beta-helix repeat-containing protein [Verrucomicrobiales bacterium]|nr:right-handed parallel beta-helix repeat-containing protein [Verrucomicrobiales bacterium]